MSIQRAEQLKRDWTDRFVVVRTGVPELRRFDGFVGQVKTVNMNCRLLIQFDTPADISWYDIDPQFVSAVDLPEQSAQANSAAEPLQSPPSAPEVKASAAAAVTPSTASASPLDIIRQQSAAKNSGANHASSPLDQIRAQATRGSQAPAVVPESTDTAEDRKTPPDSPAAITPAGGSPLDRIRAQAARNQSTAPTAPAAPAQLPVDAAPASPVSSDTMDAVTTDAVTPAATVDAFRVGTASSSPESGSRRSDTDAVSGTSEETPGTQAATPSLIDQIRAQATADGETPESVQSTLFEQIRRQAAKP